MRNAIKKLIRRTEDYLDDKKRARTANARVLPDTVIAGVMKGGTTSLFNYLIQHPQMFGSKEKEVHYFDFNYSKGIEWYRSRFPLRSEISDNTRVLEASPSYMFVPGAIERMCKDLNSPRILIVLRDPVERVFSHYRHQTRAGRELSEDFETACKRFDDESVELALKKISEEGIRQNDPLVEFIYFSYLARGRYSKQLSEIRRWVPADRLKIIISENMFHDPAQTMRDVEEFLELERFDGYSFDVFNPGNSKSNWFDGVSPSFRKCMEDYRIEEANALSKNWGLDTSVWFR